MKKLFFLLILAVILPWSGFAQRVTLSGYVRDRDSGESLIGAAVALQGRRVGTASNEYGFYSLTLDSGVSLIECSFVGYEPQSLSLDLRRDTSIVFLLKADASISEAMVSARREAGAGSSYLGSMRISRQLLETHPAVFGESDVVKIIQTLPGVQGGMAGLSGIHVRGGGADENLVMLDGTPVYNLNHMLGLFSLFMPETVKNVNIYKGSFPARYGGRASSIIDVRTMDGSNGAIHGTVSAGLFSDRFFMNGPLGKNGKTTFSVGARALHTMLLAPVITLLGSPANYAFYDLNGKLAHAFSGKDRVYISAYHGKDYFRYSKTNTFAENSLERVTSERTGLNWGNTILTGRWNHVFTNRLFSNFSLYANRYSMNLRNQLQVDETAGDSHTSTKEGSRFFSGIDDQGARADFDFSPSPMHRITFGAEVLNHIFRPQTSRISGITSGDAPEEIDTVVDNTASRRMVGQEIAVYAEDEMRFFEDRLRLVPGFRLALFTVRGRAYLSPEPRLSLAYDFLLGWSVKAGYSRMSQYVHQLTSSIVSMPTDLWVPITENIRPVFSDTWSSGLYCLALNGWEFSAEAYFRELYNVLEYKDGRGASSGTGSWEDNVETGRGRSKGVELYVRKTAGKVTGSLAYTLSKSDRWFPDGSINSGRVYPFKYDRRHVLNVDMAWKINERVDVGAAWSFASGYKITVPLRKTVMEGPDGTEEVLNYVPSRNNYTTPPSHHLDVRCNLKTESGMWNFTVYNIYNARNPDWVLYEDQSSYRRDNGRMFEIGISVRTLLTVLPSVGYTWYF